MSSLYLTLNPSEPLVLGDADVVVTILRTRGKYVQVRVDADEQIQINRGSIYIGKKLIPNWDYIDIPLRNLQEDNPELMADLLEKTADNLYFKDFTYDDLSEKAKRIFSMVDRDCFMKVVDLFLAKFLYVNQLEFNEESLELFKNNFFSGSTNHENTNNEIEVSKTDTVTPKVSNDTAEQPVLRKNKSWRHWLRH